jgi:signal transduction histidine kinase/DNA-binding response OmpR family regulator
MKLDAPNDPAAESGSAAPPAPHVDILLVDDDAKTHVAMQAMLTELGAELVSVTSGRAALMRLLRQDFALVLLDVRMPDMDGFATAELIRGRDKTRFTPIIFLTAYSQNDGHQLRAYSLGAVDFLFKPIVPAILRSKVQVFVELHRKNLELRRQAQLIRDAEQREHERRLADARQRWEGEALREQMESQRLAAEATTRKAEELARAVAERDRAADALTHSNTRLALLSDTANRLLCGQRPRQLLDELFRRLTGHLELDVYAHRSLSDDGLQLILEAHGGFLPEEVAGYEQVPLGAGLSGRCAALRQRVLLDEAHPGPIDIAPMRSTVCFPLIAEDRLIGTLAFGSRQLRRFSDEDLATLEVVANQVAMALERAQMTAELQARNAALNDADRRKDEFLAMLGHELRNPLAPIVNALHVVGHASRDLPSLSRAHEVMERQVRHLVRLVDDLLDVSRITQGKIELRRERTDTHAIVEQAVAIARPLIAARQHRLCLRLPDQPIPLWADVTRLTQVIANLLNNAAKYTNQGGDITLAVSHGDEDDVIISVRDSGIGIRTELLPRVFELFMQADHPSDRAAGGLGIGLTLVKRLAQLHGGDVIARSDGPNRGSELVVTLPVGPSDEAATAPAASTASSPAIGLRILVIEDNPDIRETLKELLEICGHEVTLAADGRLGIAAADNGVDHDVALIDIGLPGADGYEVARELAGLRQRLGHPRRLIAMTGYGQADDRRRALEAGFDAHLVKPVDPDTLTRLLATAPPRPQREA